MCSHRLDDTHGVDPPCGTDDEVLPRELINKAASAGYCVLSFAAKAGSCPLCAIFLKKLHVDRNGSRGCVVRAQLLFLFFLCLGVEPREQGFERAIGKSQ